MAFADRDYNRPSGTGPLWQNVRTWPITYWLIAINVAVFVLDALSGFRFLTPLGYFSYWTAITNLELWRFITFQFLYAGVSHILFNMVSLYFFGPIVERFLGWKRFLGFYLLCGMAGPVSYLLLLNVHVLINSPYAPLVGASAGIFGVLIAAATRVAPDARVMMLFPPIPMKLKTLAWVLVGIAVFAVLFYGQDPDVEGAHNAGGEAAHLGGAALGFLLIQRPQLLNIFNKLPGGPRRG